MNDTVGLGGSRSVAHLRRWAEDHDGANKGRIWETVRKDLQRHCSAPKEWQIAKCNERFFKSQTLIEGLVGFKWPYSYLRPFRFRIWFLVTVLPLSDCLDWKLVVTHQFPVVDARKTWVIFPNVIVFCVIDLANWHILACDLKLWKMNSMLRYEIMHEWSGYKLARWQHSYYEKCLQ